MATKPYESHNCTECDDNEAIIRVSVTNLDGELLDMAYLCEGCGKANDLTRDALRQRAHNFLVGPVERAIEQSAIGEAGHDAGCTGRYGGGR